MCPSSSLVLTSRSQRLWVLAETVAWTLVAVGMSLVATLTRSLSSAFRLGVDIHVPPGITILFGPSGCGKSTVLRCIAGLTRPEAGRIAVNDRILFDSERHIDLPPQERQVGLVFQQLALFPHMRPMVPSVQRWRDRASGNTCRFGGRAAMQVGNRRYQ